MSTLLELLGTGTNDPLSPPGRHSGVEIGIVSDDRDDEGLGRVRVTFPRLPGHPESDWLRVAVPAAGPDSGFCWIPAVHDEVLVAFDRGDPACGYVIGCLWNGRDRPPRAAAQSGGIRELRSRSGHRLVLDDRDGAERLILADGSGKRSVTFDAAAKVWRLEALDGDVEIVAPEGTVRVRCRRLELAASDEATIESAGSLDTRAGGGARIEAGHSLDLRAQRINLN